MSGELEITVGELAFKARLEGGAVRTWAAIRARLPLRGELLHARWSGEACWVPMGELALDVPAENATSYPSPGQLLLYPGGVSETEILLPYGPVSFGSRAGQLAGNHFATVVGDVAGLADLGWLVLRRGAQPITLRLR